jgi:hypothetical protein
MVAFFNCQISYALEQMMKILLAIIFLITSCSLGSVTCLAQTNSYGIIKSVSGDVLICNAQKTIKAVPNMKFVQGDLIKTGTESSVGLIFEDDTVASLGANSEITIENFLFNPVDRELSFVVRLLKGSFSFITGQIAKLAPKNVKFETPDATLGVRGTKLLIEID